MAATLACLAPWSAAARSTQAVVPGPGTGIEGPGIPDPAEATRIALEATPDGRDLRDEAWHRLVAEAAAWPRDPEAFASATVVRPRWRDAIDDPDRFRGELLEATGRLEQMDPVRTPGVPDGAVVEWFIRTDPARGGEVVQAFLPATAAVSGRVGSTVTVVGRLLRRTELEARDGRVRSFATIVGVPSPVDAAGSAWSPGWVVALATLALLPIALLVRRAAKRRPPRRSSIDPHDDGGELPREDLPKDPAEALGVLAAEHSANGNVPMNRDR